jgi:hypothetical protein
MKTFLCYALGYGSIVFGVMQIVGTLVAALPGILATGLHKAINPTAAPHDRFEQSLTIIEGFATGLLSHLLFIWLGLNQIYIPMFIQITWIYVYFIRVKPFHIIARIAYILGIAIGWLLTWRPVK